MLEVYDIGWKNEKNSAVALGYFDGVHIAHQYLIKLMDDYADKHGLQRAIFTFTKTVKLGHKGKDIYTQNQKLDCMEKLGVELFYSPDFAVFSRLTPEEFVTDVLIKSMGAKAVFCGENFFFGKNRRGNVEVLKELCQKYGIDFVEADTVKIGDTVVSSTAIRNAIGAGDIEFANKMLGRPYSVEFVVVHGKENGRKMGTPTINQIYPESMCSPLPGVYITRTLVDGVYYPSATGFGPRPTFNGTNLTCETYIKGYDGDLYDREIKVEFFKYLFGARKFDTMDELGKMIRDAAASAEEYLAEINI